MDDESAGRRSYPVERIIGLDLRVGDTILLTDYYATVTAIGPWEPAGSALWETSARTFIGDGKPWIIIAPLGRLDIFAAGVVPPTPAELVS